MSHTAGLRDEAPAFGAHDESVLATTVRSWGDDYVFMEPGRIMSSRIDLAVREGKLYFRRGAQEAEATKVGDLRFAVTPPAPAATPQTFTLVPGPDGAIGFLHMGSRALKRIPTKAS